MGTATLTWTIMLFSLANVSTGLKGFSLAPNGGASFSHLFKVLLGDYNDGVDMNEVRLVRSLLGTTLR